MEVTEVTKYKGNTFAVTLDDTDTIYLHRDLIADYGIRTGCCLTESQLAEIQAGSALRRATERALYLLDSRAYSFVELFKKLEPNYPEETCYAVVQRLAKLGMIHDARYAESLARRYVEIKHFGMRRARIELRQHGLSEEIITDALAPYADDMQERLQAVLEKKYARKLTDPTDRKTIDQVKAALVRLGYRYDEIRDGIAAYFSTLEDEPD